MKITKVLMTLLVLIMLVGTVFAEGIEEPAYYTEKTEGGSTIKIYADGTWEYSIVGLGDFFNRLAGGTGRQGIEQLPQFSREAYLGLTLEAAKSKCSVNPGGEIYGPNSAQQYCFRQVSGSYPDAATYCPSKGYNTKVYTCPSSTSGTTQTCKDSDGYNKYSKGTVTYGTQTYIDTCSSGMLVEYWCKDNAPVKTSNLQETGKVCQDGALVASTVSTTPQSCIYDSTTVTVSGFPAGVKIYLEGIEIGTTTTSSSTFNMIYGDTVKIDTTTYTVPCQTTYSIRGTSVTPGTCTDSDGGSKPAVAGYVIDKDGTRFNDICQGAGVLEATCQATGIGTRTLISQTGYSCSGNALVATPGETPSTGAAPNIQITNLVAPQSNNFRPGEIVPVQISFKNNGGAVATNYPAFIEVAIYSNNYYSGFSNNILAREAAVRDTATCNEKESNQGYVVRYKLYQVNAGEPETFEARVKIPEISDTLGDGRSNYNTEGKYFVTATAFDACYGSHTWINPGPKSTFTSVQVTRDCSSYTNEYTCKSNNCIYGWQSPGKIGSTGGTNPICSNTKLDNGFYVRDQTLCKSGYGNYISDTKIYYCTARPATSSEEAECYTDADCVSNTALTEGRVGKCINLKCDYSTIDPNKKPKLTFSSTDITPSLNKAKPGEKISVYVRIKNEGAVATSTNRAHVEAGIYGGAALAKIGRGAQIESNPLQDLLAAIFGTGREAKIVPSNICAQDEAQYGFVQAIQIEEMAVNEATTIKFELTVPSSTTKITTGETNFAADGNYKIVVTSYDVCGGIIMDSEEKAVTLAAAGATNPEQQVQQEILDAGGSSTVQDADKDGDTEIVSTLPCTGQDATTCPDEAGMTKKYCYNNKCVYEYEIDTDKKPGEESAPSDGAGTGGSGAGAGGAGAGGAGDTCKAVDAECTLPSTAGAGDDSFVTTQCATGFCWDDQTILGTQPDKCKAVFCCQNTATSTTNPTYYRRLDKCGDTESIVDYAYCPELNNKQITVEAVNKIRETCGYTKYSAVSTPTKKPGTLACGDAYVDLVAGEDCNSCPNDALLKCKTNEECIKAEILTGSFLPGSTTTEYAQDYVCQNIATRAFVRNCNVDNDCKAMHDKELGSGQQTDTEDWVCKANRCEKPTVADMWSQFKEDFGIEDKYVVYAGVGLVLLWFISLLFRRR